MEDDEFLRRFADGTLSEFHHVDHLRLTLLTIAGDGEDDAVDSVATGIRRFADHQGQSDKYHETMTRFWVRIVGHVLASRPGIRTVDDLLAAFPPLRDKHLPFRHWTRDQLMSSHARAEWVEPDLRPMP